MNDETGKLNPDKEHEWKRYVQETQVQENKMGVWPVNRLLISMSVPIMVSMLVQALYNVVDSIFVAKLSENALNAVSLAFPVQNLMIAVATGTGVGINALLSKSLGEKNFQTSQSGSGQRCISGGMQLHRICPAGRLFLPHFLYCTDRCSGDRGGWYPVCGHLHHLFFRYVLPDHLRTPAAVYG